jgi:hypothetical protein
MSSVRARVWRFTVEKGMAGAEAVQAVEVGQGSLPVSVAAVVNINALACDLRKTVDQRVRDHEISLCSAISPAARVLVRSGSTAPPSTPAPSTSAALSASAPGSG